MCSDIVKTEGKVRKKQQGSFEVYAGPPMCTALMYRVTKCPAATGGSLTLMVHHMAGADFHHTFISDWSNFRSCWISLAGDLHFGRFSLVQTEFRAAVQILLYFYFLWINIKNCINDRGVTILKTPRFSFFRPILYVYSLNFETILVMLSRSIFNVYSCHYFFPNSLWAEMLHFRMLLSQPLILHTTPNLKYIFFRIN